MSETKLPSHVKTLGEAVRFIRERKGMSLRQLASRTGVSAPFLGDIERNRRSTNRLPELASALDVDVETLRAFDGRIGADLREWMAANPGMVAVLREMHASGRGPGELLSDMHRSRRQPACKRAQESGMTHLPGGAEGMRHWRDSRG